MSADYGSTTDGPIKVGCAVVLVVSVAFILFFVLVLIPAGNQNDERRKACYASGGTDIGRGNVRCVHGLTEYRP